jgi:hypothetical protein
MAQAALDRGLDGVVITEHNVLWSRDEIERLQRRCPALKILRGIEVSAKEGHALVYGVSESETVAFYPDMPIGRVTRIAHQAGGIVILAHPARYEDVIPGSVYAAGLDGVELFSRNIRLYMEAAIQDLYATLGKPGIAATDAHAPESLGLYATVFETVIDDEQDLVRAIQTQAFALHCDLASVCSFNRQIEAQTAQMQRLLGENALSEQVIRAKYGFPYSFQRNVRQGRDMQLRILYQDRSRRRKGNKNLALTCSLEGSQR